MSDTNRYRTALPAATRETKTLLFYRSSSSYLSRILMLIARLPIGRLQADPSIMNAVL